MRDLDFTSIDRALRDLAMRLEKRGEEEYVKLSVRDVRALLAKLYQATARSVDATEKAEAAAEKAEDAEMLGLLGLKR
jgi:hypothetical protein